MTNKKYSLRITVLTALLVIMSVSCTRDVDVLEPATFPKTPDVFIDGFSAGLNYSAFGGSDVTAFDVDTDIKYKGTASMKIAVPDFEDPAGAYAGGAYYTNAGRDLSGYDALTFWIKASKAATIDVLGFGNDLAELKYVTTLLGANVNTNWKKVIIPIPDPSKLIAERGMFYYSEGNEDGSGYTFWVDEVKFEKLGTIAHKKPAILEEQDQTASAEIGEQLTIGGTFANFNMPNGVDQRVEVAPSYFSFASSDSMVAIVNELGVVTVMDSGNAVITAKLGSTDAKGSLTVEAVGALPKPSAPAPEPTVNADSVISLFSNVYTDVKVDTWNPFWEFSTAEVTDIQIAGNDVKLYKKLNFVGIEFVSETIDASEMTHFHLDIWTPDPTDAATFEAKLVDFGVDNAFGGDNDSEVGVTISSPTLVTGSWISVDMSLAGLPNRANVAQLVLVGNESLNNVYVDNVYFYNDGSGGGGGGGTQPGEAAPIPTQDAGDVLSLFSDAYTDVTVDTWRTEWSVANFEDVSIAGNAVKKYSALDFVGITTEASTVDASGMTHVHLDVWSADFTQFGIKLVDFGADGSFDGGDDVEHQIDITTPAQGEWVSLDLPLSDFTGLTTRSNLAQYILVGQPSGATTVFVDNFYFYNDDGSGGGGGTEPTQPAPTPTQDAADVLSLFSDDYTDVTVDTWRTEWSVADFEDVSIAGNAVKKYSALDFVGITTEASTVDASGMTHVHLDVWSADFTQFGIKLVDFGADGSFDGGDDVEHQIDIATPNQGEWVSIDLSLSDLTGLTTRSNLAQYILVGQPTGATTVFIDNFYFYNDAGGGGGGGTEPTQPAPTPSFAEGDVISLFSNAYTNVTVDTWSADWDAADLEDIQIGGDDVKLYTNLIFSGTEFTSQTIDGTGMTHFYMNLWTPDDVTPPAVFKIKIVDFGADGEFDGGDDVEHEIFLDNTTTPAIGTGTWLTLDIPLTDFPELTTKGHLAQLIFSGDPNTIYVDNILFHK